MTNRLAAPIEMWEQTTWEILDPNTAKLVAVFYDEAEALAYQKLLNNRNLRGEPA